MVMAPADSQRAWWIDWSAASESHRQSQLRGVRAVAGVTGHYYHCVAANPGARKRKRKRATGPPADVMAGRDGGHFPGSGLWRIFWSGNRYSDDRRFDLYFAGRDSPCRCTKEFFEWLDAWSRGVCARARWYCGLEVRGADGRRWFGWRLHRGNSVASRKPDCCSLDRYRDRSCGVSALFLEVVRQNCHARRRRVGGNSDARAP